MWDPAAKAHTLEIAFDLARELTPSLVFEAAAPPSGTTWSARSPALSDAFVKSPYAIPYVTSFISLTTGHDVEPSFILFFD